MHAFAIRLRDQAPLAATLDVVAVVAFVALGRRTHDEGLSVTGIGAVVAPFLLALGIAWAITRAWRAPADVAVGVNLWLLTSLIGMVLRRVVFQRSTAMAFVIVGTVMLGLLLVGWRLLAQRLAR